MNQPDNHDDLERRLRAAFAAQAEQIEQQDLDLEREDEVADRMRAASGTSRARRIVAGVGILAAAAAAVGVVAIAIQPGPDHTTNAVHPAITAVPSSATSTSVSSREPSAGVASRTAAGGHASAGVVQPPTSTIGPSSTHTAGPPPTTTSTTPPPDESGDTAPTQMSMASAATALPPTMPAGLPQSAGVTPGVTYAGAVPLGSGGSDGTRMLSMPDGTKWEVTAQADHSMTVRLTDLPVDIEAYWSTTLPSRGWQRSAGGWAFSGTAYAVSPISDKGSFTVSW